MSMLTPPGMGGKYRVTGDRYPQMRRPRGRRRIVLASIATVAALSLAGWGTFQLIDVFSGGGSGTARASSASGEDCGDTESAKGEAVGKNGKSESEKDGKSGKDGEDSKGNGKDGKLPKPGSITVNVLNATKQSGLAKSTSEELKKRGFKIGKVGNAPAELDKKVKSAGVLLGAPGKTTASNFKVLGTQLKGADTRYDERDGDDVDLVLGDDFKKLAKEKDADKALAALAHPKPSAKPSQC
ncbi:LytR C-terminal domain-containing protein [Streptomyces daliensis]|uniref:LytR C-terminal domain-containing protein n=1 Tax=Streptomyces daliensis TaxID=299421 RepID=A0A8T4IQX9_9ACTN|nr:LytR C-terminal domain-containing protein [Streptomyces daliensis]